MNAQISNEGDTIEECDDNVDYMMGLGTELGNAEEGHTSLDRTASTPASLPNGLSVPAALRLSAIPALPPINANRTELWDSLMATHDLAVSMAKWIDANAAWVTCYSDEVGRLRNLLYGKQNKPKNHFLNTKARVLTNEEILDQIRVDEEAIAKKKAEKATKGGKRGRKKVANTGKENAATTQPGKKRGRPKGSKNRSARIDIGTDDENGSIAGADAEEYVPRPTRSTRNSAQRPALTTVPQNNHMPAVDSTGNVESVPGLTANPSLVSLARPERSSTRSTRMNTTNQDDENPPNISDMQLLVPNEAASTSSGQTSALLPRRRTARAFKRPVRSENQLTNSIEDLDAFFTIGPTTRAGRAG